MRANWLIVCLVSISHASSAAVAAPTMRALQLEKVKNHDLRKVDVIGRDQRVRLPNELAAVAKGIGIVFQSGGGWACTAFCVKPSVIATNAHCLFGRPNQRKTIRLDKTRFALAANNRGSFYKSSSLVVRDRKQPGLSLYSGYYRSRQSLLEFRNDWALAKLGSPICKGAELEIAKLSPGQISQEAKGDRLLLIGYHGDKQMDGKWLSRRCRVRSTRDRKYLLPSQRQRLQTVDSLVLHTCDATRGASGSPLFVHSQNGFKVVAMNAGTIGFTKYRRTRTGRRGRIVVSRATNVAVLSSTFANGLERFSSERLLKSVKEFERVQQLLQSIGLYGGPIDGLYGPGSRRAIAEYERSNQMAALGIPTRRLLTHLETHVAKLPVQSRTLATLAPSERRTSSSASTVQTDTATASGVLPLVQRIQRRLTQLGCYQGPIDGLWGPQSRRALTTALGSSQFAQPSSAVLAKLNIRNTTSCR